ncbi:MAG: hypothetical protein KAU48_08425 [Candidatus Thorarchaeota archaeon]|nr:hypothetical protein [Candidatus Thorarchaeota archaeon]
MAFEDELGHDPSQQSDQNYALSATELVSKTISLWARKIMQYIAIVGFIGAACVAVSFVLLFSLFGTIGTLGADPISYLLSLFFGETPGYTLVVVSVGFAVFAFILHAIIHGAAIKFTLDEYGGKGGEVGTSFSYSFGRVRNIIIVQLLLSFLVAIILVPAITLTGQALGMIDISDPMNPIFPPGSIELLMSAMGFFIVGGIFLIYINVRFAPTLAIVIDTDLSAIDSLKRAWELTSGNFFHVFVSYILLNIAFLFFSVIVTLVVSFTFLPLAYLYVIEAVVTALLFSSLSFIFTSVLYRDLSSRTSSSTVSSSLDELSV